MPDAPTPDDLAAIRARHVPMGLRCVECSEGWPCDAARLIELLDAAECRLATKGGGTLVVTAAELRRAHAEARAIAERAQFWAAGWRRAAYDFRDRGGVALDALMRLERAQTEAFARLARAAAVVEAARACAPILVQWEQGQRLAAALAALDTARGDDAMVRSVVASQAIAGVVVSEAEARRLLDDVRRESPPKIGKG